MGVGEIRNILAYYCLSQAVTKVRLRRGPKSRNRRVAMCAERTYDESQTPRE